jgi:hypothetical protein
MAIRVEQDQTCDNTLVWKSRTFVVEERGRRAKFRGKKRKRAPE